MIENIDVDKTWDGKGSLDEHRQKEFEKIKQRGFGAAAFPDDEPKPKPIEPEVTSDGR